MRRKQGNLLILLGIVLILAAVLLTGYNRWEERQSARSVAVATEHIQNLIVPKEPVSIQTPLSPAEPGLITEHTEQVYPDHLLNPHMEMPEQTIDGWEYIGILEIPALGLTLPIISQWSYPALNAAPARYYGSAYLDNLVIAAHNYTSHFGTLYRLNPGAGITFTDMEGNVFSYEVEMLETLQAADVEEMCSGEWDLTLFTCTVGGKTRVTVRCSRVVESICPETP